MTVKVDFIFDFGSPNAYFSLRVLPSILDRTGAELNLIPCLLGGIFKATGNQPPMLAFGNIKNKLDYEMLETRRFVEKHQLNKFVFNPHFPVNTLMLMRGAIVAQQRGQLDAYVEAGLAAMWEDSLKMDDPEVYIQSMTKAGFDGAELLEATQDASVKQKLIDNTEMAVQRGAFGIPTFFVGEEMFFGKDRLGLLEEQLVRSQP